MNLYFEAYNVDDIGCQDVEVGEIEWKKVRQGLPKKTRDLNCSTGNNWITDDGQFFSVVSLAVFVFPLSLVFTLA